MDLRAPVLPTVDLRGLFLRSYPRFAPHCRQYTQPGLALVAVHEATGRLAGFRCMLAEPGAPSVSIIGRHSCADIRLADNHALSLRHLAVMLEPVRRWDAGHVEVRYRVLDLHTPAGLADEEGRELRAVRCEAAAVLRVCGYALYCLPLGDPSDWPESARDAWDFLPERVYFDELTRFPEGSSQIHLRKRRNAISRICRALPPVTLGDDAASSGSDTVGRIVLLSDGAFQTMAVRADELKRGLLIGRYGRCRAGLSMTNAVSRVHLLVARCGDAVYAMDASSTNGTHSGGRERRVVRLGTRQELTLGRAAVLVWATEP